MRAAPKKPSAFRGLCFTTGEKYRTKRLALIPLDTQDKGKPTLQARKSKNSRNNEKDCLTLLHSNQKKLEQLFYSSATGDDFF